MGKVQNEDLRLNIIVNGDAGHKEILSLQRSMKDAKLAIKTYLEQLYLSAIRTECSHCSLPECHLDQAKRMERSLDYARDDNQGWQNELHVKTAGKTAFLRTKHRLESKMAGKRRKSRPFCLTHGTAASKYAGRLLKASCAAHPRAAPLALCLQRTKMQINRDFTLSQFLGQTGILPTKK